MFTIRKTLKKYVPQSVTKGLIRTVSRLNGNGLPRLIYGKATYNADGLVTIHNADFIREPRFAAAYAAGEATQSWVDGDVFWRAYVLCWAANRAASLPGDFVECGVYRGGYSMTVCKYVHFETLPKKFYLLDTYEGLVERYMTPDEKARGIYNYKPSYDAVVESFRPFPNVKIIKGAVPETLSQVESDQICYLSIDMNTRDPEIAAAEYFWDKLVSGAVMVLDDYGWRKHIEQKIAFDAFAQKRGLQVLALPTGQGLIFKP